MIGGYINDSTRNAKNSIDAFFNSIIDNENGKKKSKEMCQTSYNDILKIPVNDEKDSNFMVQAYGYAYSYYVFSLADKLEASGTPEEQYKKALENYKKATVQSRKIAYYINMKEAFMNMDDEQKKEYRDSITDTQNNLNAELSDTMKDSDDATDLAQKASNDASMEKYKSPVNSKNTKVASTIDDVIDDAKNILDHDSQIEITQIRDFSNSIFNIFLTIGIVVATVVGSILGIKFITSSVEGKADVKKMLIVYVVGCIAVFGAFTIWKVVVTILQGI